MVVAGVITATSMDLTSSDGFTVGTGASVSSPETNVLTLGTNNTERLRVDSNGRVGIGTDNPSVKLEIVDSGSPNIALRGSSYPSIRYSALDGTTDAEIYYGISGNDLVLNNVNAGPISFKTTNTERLGITSTGDINVAAGSSVFIANGNLVFSTAGTGIDFSAASNAAGMTSELLSDYEEGNFTPSFTGSTTNPTITYLNQLGRYTKIGNVCFIEIRMVTSNVSGGGGNLKISGLPFSQSPNSNLGGAFTKGFVYQWAQDPETFITFSGDSNIGIYRNDSTNTIAQVSDLTSGAYLNISGSYITA